MQQGTLKVNQSFLELPKFQQALVHKSVSQKNNNERLEFLGDAVIEIVISEYLFHVFPSMNEGSLTQIRASLVNTQSLSEIFLMLECKDKLRVSKGTNNLDETHKHSIYAGTLEACVGAIFIELGWEESKAFILDIFGHKLQTLNESDDYKDAKSRLQERLQALDIDLPLYHAIANKQSTMFTCEVQFQKQTFSAASSLKKDAEQKVAELILTSMDRA